MATKEEQSFETFLNDARRWDQVRVRAGEENEATFPALLRRLLHGIVIDKLAVSIEAASERSSNDWTKAMATMGKHSYYFYPVYMMRQGEKYNNIWTLEGADSDAQYHLKNEDTTFHECELCHRLLLLYDKLHTVKGTQK